jgi:hypothetical protein
VRRAAPHAQARRTRFALEHNAHVDDEFFAQFGPGAVGIGWDQAVLGLTRYLTSPAELPEREAVEAWQQSDEGRQFTSLSSERWAEASIAAGHRRRRGARSRGAHGGLIQRPASSVIRH